MAAADDAADRAFLADRRDLDRPAVGQLDDQRDHRRAERELAAVDISPRLSTRCRRPVRRPRQRARAGRGPRQEGREQAVARERLVEPLELVVVSDIRTKPPELRRGEAAYFITRPARDITRVKLTGHNYIRMGSTTSWRRPASNRRPAAAAEVDLAAALVDQVDELAVDVGIFAQSADILLLAVDEAAGLRLRKLHRTPSVVRMSMVHSSPSVRRQSRLQRSGPSAAALANSISAAIGVWAFSGT